MAGIKDYSTTQINNSDLNGISVAEGMLPSNLNNAIRALMKNTREWFNDSQWVEYGDGSGAYTAAYASATSFTIAGVDVSAIYHEGRRIKLIAATPGTIFGTISSSSFSTNTTVNVTWDSGSLSNEAITNVYIGALSKTNNSFPTGVIATATLADGSVTTIKIADSAVTTAKINDAAVTNAKLGADSVNGSKIADNSIDSEHYVDGSIDTIHIADAQITTDKITDFNVTTDKIANSNVTNAKLADNSVTTAKISNLNVTTGKIAADAIDGTKIADDSINSEHYVDGSIDTAHIADSQITTAKVADANITTAKILDANVTTAKIADSNITTAKIANDAVTSDKIADAVIVTNSEASGSTPNDTTFFTTSASDGRYFRQDSSETIDSGDTWSASDDFIATTAAIDARVIDLVDDVGGFFPIENETSFPNTNPDVNDGAGTIVSIKEIATTRTPSSGTVTIASGTVGGSTVTITGCGSTVLTSGFGVLVETSTTLNTYTFHRLVPKATEVTTVASISSDITTVANDETDIGVVSGLSSDIQTLADIEDGTVATNAISNVGNIASDVTAVANDATDIGTVATDLTGSDNIGTVATNIANVNLTGGSIANVNTVGSNIGTVNEFGERYRVEASAPTTSLDVGDLYFDTSTSILNVYGSSGWQNAGSSVNGTSQRYNYTATSGQTTFTGADNGGNTLAYDAGFIDVYLNGVKLLNGTDVTVTSGTSVVLASGATTGDVVDIVAYGTFSVASLNADNLDSGTVPDARISASSVNQHVDLSNLNATNLTSGTVPDARITGAYTGITNLTMSGDLTVDTSTLYVDSTNNRVGIGNSSPTGALDVKSSTQPQLKVATASATADRNAGFLVTASNSATPGSRSVVVSLDADGGDGSGTDNLTITKTGGDGDATITNESNANIVFGTNNTERMRIDSSGNVMFGKTTQGDVGVVGAEIRNNGLGTFTRDGDTTLILNRETSDGNILQLRKDNTTIGNIGSREGRMFLHSPSPTGSGIRMGDAFVMPCDSDGSNSDNDTALGQANSRFTDLYLSGGAYLGGTGSANKLDDYEQGTFTPVLEFGNATTGITYSNRDGMYVKVGELVMMQIFIELSNKGSASGDATISGLPFTMRTLSNGWSGVGAGSMTWTNFASRIYSILTNPNRNTQELGISGVTNSSGEFSAQALNSGDFNNNTYFGITLSYRTT